MQLRDYLRRRKLAFALIAVRDTNKSILDIALDHGFSSHAAFTRAFKDVYGVTPLRTAGTLGLLYCAQKSTPSTATS